ncbi:Serine/threonine-protein kinase PknD [Planctomycetes bacterium Pan216]|uniref:Serine/threonine-protein kinase PknD n=1 Tax=Kolteria novifilia TaxID=2527975 RepID=A0A518AX54_9BACT|nr:Serine/threonine-protein kinase PknD [Planctomycetes bacterium Pan216]
MASPSPLPVKDIERYQVATALLGGVVTEAQLRRALNASRSRPGEELALFQILIKQGVLLPEQKLAFDQSLKALLRSSGGDADEVFRQVLDSTLSSAFEQVRDPSVRHYLRSGRCMLGNQLASETTARYMLTRVHAQGGIGEVWLGHDMMLNRDVAVKRIREDVDHSDTTRRRFLREGRLTGRLQHPNIPAVYVVGGDAPGEDPFYSMRFINGEPLSKLIAQAHDSAEDGKLPYPVLSRLLTVFLSVCDAVGYAHSQGIIHRDLKPPNVVVGRFGEVFLVDWGVAKSTSLYDEASIASVTSMASSMSQVNQIGWETRTRAGDIVGTPAFMSPEQAAGHTDQVDQRTDVYGLGSILYSVLTGKAPHQRQRGEDPDKALERIATTPVRPPRTINPNCSRSLSAVCVRAMANDRDARYQHATELADDVRSWLAGEPTKAFQEPWSQRLARWVVRNQNSFRIGTALLVVAILIATMFIGYGWAVSIGIEKTSLNEFSDSLTNLSLSLHADAAMLANQTRFLAEVPELKTYLKALQNDNKVIERAEEDELTARISTFLEHQRGSMQVTLVLVKPKPHAVFHMERSSDSVDPVRVGASSELDESQLAELTNAAIKLPPGQVFASPGEAELRGKRYVNDTDPFVHLVASIRFRASEDPIGVVILHSSFSPSFPSLLGSEADRFRFNSNFYLTNEQGEILGYYVSYVPPGTILDDTPTNITDIFPDLEQLFQDKSMTTFSSLRMPDVPHHQNIVYSMKERIEDWHPSRQYALVLAISESKALHPGEHWLHITFVATLVILVLAVSGLGIIRRTLNRVAGRIH